MNTLRECLYATVHRNRKPLKAIAEEIGAGANHLTRMVLPDPDESETGSGCNFPLKYFIPLLRVTGDLSALDLIEDTLGRVAIPVPKANESLKDICRLTMKSVKEFGELMANLDSAMADGKLTEDEIAALQGEGYDAVQAITNLLHSIKTK